MSAIAGLYRMDGEPVSRHEVERMILALAHRGRDGTGAWSSGPAALAHGALWTTPQARQEPQPLASAACRRLATCPGTSLRSRTACLPSRV